MQKENRTDRILISIALAILLLASSLFYFDGWMWGTRRDRAASIGKIVSHTGDVRMKFEGDLRWQRASSDQDLVYNDSVYAGAGSSAKLKLGESEMMVTENTLVVLRREDKVNFMDLSYGSLFGKVGKNEKILIDTGSGKPIELNTKSATQVVIRKNAGRTELDVVSGEAAVEVNGKKTLINKTTRVVVEKNADPKLEEVGLKLIQPLSDQVTYSEDPTKIPFKWSWTAKRMPSADESFKLEFSGSPLFRKVLTEREVKGALSTELSASQSLNLYYRIKGPRGVVSSTERVNFVRMHAPLILKPEPNSKFTTAENHRSLVGLQFQKPEQAKVEYQLASDVEFKNLVGTENSSETQFVRDLPPGNYFLRAKADYPDNHSTKWTAAVPFNVERKIEPLQLTQNVAQKSRIVIPNRKYPDGLYQSSVPKVRAYLANHGLLQEFFPFSPGSFDELKLSFIGGEETEELSQTDIAWPRQKMNPGRFTFKYQASKTGFLPTRRSEPRKMEITMEPPRPLDDVVYGPVEPNGQSEGVWTFTPILFAKSYDVELSNDPYMRSPRLLHVEEPRVKAKLIGENYWRARARDAQGHIISDFSSPYKLKGSVPVFLAKNPPPTVRKPAVAAPVANSSTVKIERVREEAFEKDGWWAWVGGGEDYIDYKQSVPNRSTVEDHRLGGPTSYVETGFIDAHGWGGILSYKRTPGELRPAGAPVDNNSYDWTSFSIEGVHRSTSSLMIGDSPIVYGLRVGIQQHQLPFLFLDENGNASLKANESTNASLGVLAEWTRRRWTYYWLMRYQYPISSKAAGSDQFSITPVFSFDGSIGTSYNITKQLKAGMFWYGQWHQFNFLYSDGEVESRGFQSLFYSNVDLRLGFDF